jgi:nuclear mRNA export protein SAC3
MSRSISDSFVESSTPRHQVFSERYVEKKRYHRTLSAVMNGMGVAEAIRSGFIEAPESSEAAGEEAEDDADEPMFVSQEDTSTPSTFGSFGSRLNPTASSFTPVFGQPPAPAFGISATQSTIFGKPVTPGGSATAVSTQPQQSLPAFGQATGSSGAGFVRDSLFGSNSTPLATQAESVNSPRPAAQLFGAPATTTKAADFPRTGPVVGEGFGQSILKPKQPVFSLTPTPTSPATPAFNKDIQGFTAATPAAPSPFEPSAKPLAATPGKFVARVA